MTNTLITSSIELLMKKKILYYSDCFIFGGCENVLVNLINSKTVNEHFEIHYAYAWNRDYQRGVDSRFKEIKNKYPLRILSNINLFYRINMSGVNKYAAILLKLPFVFIGRTGIYALYNYLRLFFLFKRLKPDILHINSGGYPGAHSCLVAVFSAKRAGIKKIVFNVNNLAKKQKNFFEKLADRYIDKQVDCFITASGLARARLIENRQFRPEKVIQIFNAMQQEKVVKNRDELLAEHHFAADKFVMVCVAFLTERKGQIYLLEALKNIKDTNREIFENMVLFLVGDGEDRFKIERYLNKHQLTNNVIITGYRSDYYDFINAADLFVLPSIKDEDMPLVILSAMGLGKAIVSTRVAGITEEIRDGIDGFLLNPMELNKLAGVIMELYRNRELRSRYGSNALKRYYDCFAIDNVIKKYIDIYNGLLYR